MGSTLLVAEDHDAARQLILHALEDQGYGIVFARDGREALELLEQKPFAAALVDISLPGISGIEICERVRASSELARTPIILMSGALGPRELAAESERVGADAFLAKPFSIDELRTVVRAFMRIRQQAIEIDDLRSKLDRNAAEEAAEQAASAVILDWTLPYHEFMKLARKKYFLHALAIAGGNKSRLARKSGLDRSTLYVHFRNLGMLATKTAAKPAPSPGKAPRATSSAPPQSGSRQ